MTDSIDVAIGVVEGKVVAKWHQPTQEIVFDPQNAYKVGMALCQGAMDAHNGNKVNAKPFIEDELAKPKVSDAQRMLLVNIVATQLKTLIEQGKSHGYIALHAVDAVLQQVAR